MWKRTEDEDDSLLEKFLQFQCLLNMSVTSQQWQFQGSVINPVMASHSENQILDRHCPRGGMAVTEYLKFTSYLLRCVGRVKHTPDFEDSV